MSEETYSVGQLVMCIGSDLEKVLLGCITSTDCDNNQYTVDWEISGESLTQEFRHLCGPLQKKHIKAFRNYYYTYMKYRMNK